MVSVSVLEIFVIKKVSVSVSKKFGIEKSIGIGFVKFWYRKKYRYRYRKKLVSKKVSDSVSKKFGIEKSIGIGFVKFWYRKKYRIRYQTNFVSEKSIGFGIEQIWYRKKVLDSVSFRFWVSSLTAMMHSLMGVIPKERCKDDVDIQPWTLEQEAGC